MSKFAVFAGVGGVATAGAIAIAVATGALDLSGKGTPAPEPTAMKAPDATDQNAPAATQPTAQPQAAPAPESTAADTAKAEPQPTPDTVPAAATKGTLDLALPRFDLVRAEADGPVLVAGQAIPGSRVEVLVDRTPRAEAATASDGKFVTFLDLETAEQPRVLSLRMSLGKDVILSDEEVILAPASQPEPVVTAMAAPATDAPAEAAATPESKTVAETTPDAVQAPQDSSEPDTATPEATVQADTGNDAGTGADEGTARASAGSGPDSQEPAVTASTTLAPSASGQSEAAQSAAPAAVAAAEPGLAAPLPAVGTAEPTLAAPAPAALPEQPAGSSAIPATRDIATSGRAPTAPTAPPAAVAAAEPGLAAPLPAVGTAEPNFAAPAPAALPEQPAITAIPATRDIATSEPAPTAPAAPPAAVASAEPGLAAPLPAVGTAEPNLTAPTPGALPEQPAQTDTAPNPTPRDVATSEPAPNAPAAPAVIMSSARGINVLPTTPLLPGDVALDAINYDAAGDVELTGRGAEAGFVRVYLDNAPLTATRIEDSGQWRVTLPDVDTGTYTLRVDQINEAGAVTARVESPFLRESPEALAAAGAAANGPVSSVTVQPGNTLWAIARDRYGEGIEYVKVFKANKDRIRDPDLIYPGQIFDLPTE